MASDNSFDVVSKVDLAEVKNAVDQATKEINTRFDLKDTKSRITIEGADAIQLASQDEYKLEAVKDAELPPEMQKMNADERKAYVAKQQETRAALNKKLEELARQRADFIEQEKKRLVKEGKGDAFDLKVGEIINEQAKRKK